MKGLRCWLIIGFVPLLVVCACERKADLQGVINQELATGQNFDSLFLGIHFGMERTQFFDHCWEMNRDGVITEGPNNLSVQYLFDDPDGHPIAFNFYPEFEGDVAHRYRANFKYYAWAPWNKHLQSDKLVKVLEDIFVEWYGGNRLIKVAEDGKTRFFKIDGNRAIELSIYDEQLVLARFHDLSFYKRLD